MHFSKIPALGMLTVALLLGAGAAEAATLTRQPYLQRVGPDTALIAFRLDSNCTAEVRYGTQGSTNQTARSADSGRTHAVVLTGLIPGAEYTYEVEACGTRTPAKRFRTAPVPGTRRVHFAAVGDFGTGGSAERRVAAAIQSRRPELFIALGDNAYESGTEAEIQNNLFRPLEEVLAEVPFFPVAGNHEYVTDQAQPYLDNLYLPTSPSGGERYYSFDWGHVHFVGLDSNCAVGLASAERCTLEAQKAWLEQDLAASQAAWKIVYFHHPPWSSGKHGSQPLMRQEFGPIFERYGVDLVLTGHDHNYERSHPMKGDAVAPAGTKGITYLVVGGGGANLRSLTSGQPAWSAVRNDTTHAFLDVVVSGGTLSAQLLAPEGEVVDSFTLTKQLPPELPRNLKLIVEGERGVAPHQAFFRAELPSPGATVRWDFGDGGSSEGAEARHTYSQPGEYTVTATASAGGASVSSTAQVSVAAPAGGSPPGPTPPPATPPSAGTPPSSGTPPSPGAPTSPGTPSGLGGDASSGCSTVPVGALLPLSALVLAGLLRRRRH
jgi:uncharacterized protein (TIGR03382 family)